MTAPGLHDSALQIALRLLPTSANPVRDHGRTTNVHTLTNTERSVADLVAQGLTNRQVAGQMFLSPHTVSFHLCQVFRKLGIGSRVELARHAAGQPSQESSPNDDLCD
ncbi:helix-turn-helix transcriptional regulator [Nonomuraea sp. B19D2]